MNEWMNEWIRTPTLPTHVVVTDRRQRMPVMGHSRELVLVQVRSCSPNVVTFTIKSCAIYNLAKLTRKVGPMRAQLCMYSICLLFMGVLRPYLVTVKLCTLSVSVTDSVKHVQLWSTVCLHIQQCSCIRDRQWSVNHWWRYWHQCRPNIQCSRTTGRHLTAPT